MTEHAGSDGRPRSPLRVGLVGCGDIAPMHLDAITANPDAQLVAVADVDPDAAAITADRYGGQRYRHLDAMLDDAALDVVHICTPHHLHAPMAIAAARRGVHVLVEKPVATDPADADAVTAAAAASGATVGVCFQNRYNTTSQRIRELLDSGELGAVLGGRASVTWFRDAAYYARRPWRGTWSQAGGGVLINQAIHTLDLLQWYLGEAVDVRGCATQLVLAGEIEVEDTAVVHLTHSGGATSLFYATNGYSDNAPIALELRTEKAVLRLEGDLTIAWADGRTEMVRETAIGSGAHSYWGAAHRLLIDDFYRHVSDGRGFWIDPAEARKTLVVLDQVYAQSAVRGPRRPSPASA